MPFFNRLYLLYLGASNAFMAHAITSVRTLLLDLICIVDAAACADESWICRGSSTLSFPHQNLRPHIHGALDFPINKNFLQSIRRLTLGMTFDRAGQARRLLTHTSKTLEDLVIYHGDTWKPRPVAGLVLPHLLCCSSSNSASISSSAACSRPTWPPPWSLSP
ncbi:hypothetical protein C8R44DRAFT_151036 [Mycena epipterygia]|nr:hypothetical protein C8R44DRAFT_151036 [Mycena epipterygia]